MKDRIVIRGARQHNLKGFDLEIPRRSFTVITGPSGSGKSSLAFDTIYAEGQRRYVESLSAYARQFLERMEKPLVDAVEGLSPAVAIEQKNPTKTSRSTVGTATEVYDYLRLLWARVGRSYCPVCGRELRPDTPQSVRAAIESLPEGTRFSIAFPLRLSAKVTHAVVVENLRAQGFVRVAIAGEPLHLDDVEARGVDLTTAPDLMVVVDRLAIGPDVGGRLGDALGTAFREGDGDAAVLFASPVASPVPVATPHGLQAGQPVTVLRFTERYECPNDGTRLPAPTPQLFSFNNPRGACETCNGFGAILEYDEALIVPNPERTLRDGAIQPWTMPRYEAERRKIVDFARKEGIPVDAPWRTLSRKQQELVLHGKARGFLGAFPFLRSKEEKRYKQYIRVFLRQYQTAQECPTCRGAKLKPETLQIRVGGASIAEAAEMPVDRLTVWLDALALSPSEKQIAEHILLEAQARVRFLCDVGLGYLSLNRATRTLSGGEAQRIGLANSLGAQLVDTLYVLDEPSIGLHSRDMQRLLRLLHRLRDGGNTVLVVEHDPEAIEVADYMVELGPESGEKGGYVVFAGPMARVKESPLTGQYLTGARSIPVPAERRRLGPRWLTLTGAREHNLKGVDLRVPLGAMTCVTGVSGSGKSTLVHDVLYRALEQKLTGEHSAKQHLGEKVGRYDALTGWETLDDVVLVDQSPIGRSPRSNPVTYVKAYDEIRRIFAAQPLARQRGFTASTFSFNSAGGRCETCEGAGYLEVEMVFMADVFVPCDQCGGKRFKPEVLEVTVHGRTIHDVLQLTIDEAIRFFPREEKLGQALWQLQQVGLGYLRLGQPATTLSGGEAQRVKIARELALSAKSKGRKLYVMDEPTTGLHLEDIRKLGDVLDRLVDAGHTLVLIEHNLDVIKRADWVVDLGPEAGVGGGEIIAQGTPEEILAEPRSHTGRFLRRVLPGPDAAPAPAAAKAPAKPRRPRARAG
ncbi:excinuclease ABC subunit UvrA [Roseisolibacter sp. H3M3-2]|uniref:excinuclease ABC subunit UvrA n=1 Tax=Roseisolibacter sp. H3M3-2 TaxID=3031323 RepID=UPI0023DADDFF|nr:excinuclease ABC subunit UvrA [Roseisolibacter sp. H3M3-2]MDF1502075.1 excinuclease ABC subunit UvrA [Roseisolibacter sp. H3M3-2]